MSKICTFLEGGQPAIGAYANGSIVSLTAAWREMDGDFQPRSMKELLAAGRDGLDAIEKVLRSDLSHRKCLYAESAVTFLAPVPDPGKFLCLAGNYTEHLAEAYGKDKVKLPSDIHVFVKSNTSVIGPYDDIVVPRSVTKLDYEIELGFVIGKKGRYIPENKSSDHIAGYFVANDVSDRAFMPEVPGGRIHWYPMKARDYFAPFGPYILLKEGVASISELTMELYVNGELRQSVDPANMVFRPEWIVSRISSWVTLEPGDIIITGTPAGNAWSRQDFLQDGDVVEARMASVGTIMNKIVFEDELYRFN